MQHITKDEIKSQKAFWKRSTVSLRDMNHGSVSLSVLLFAIRLHENAISECMSKICDGGQDWEVEFWKSEKILNKCRIEFNESSLPAEVISCLFACYYYKDEITFASYIFLFITEFKISHLSLSTTFT